MTPAFAPQASPPHPLLSGPLPSPRLDEQTGQGFICQYVFEIDFNKRTWRKLLRRKKQNRRPAGK